MNMKSRQQLLAILAVVALALLIGDKVIFTPLARTWKERSTRLADLKGLVNQGSLLLDRESAIRTRWESMRTNTVPGEVSVAESQVLSAFDRWSKESRIGISSIKPLWKSSVEDFATLECRVDAFGSLSSLTRFLYEIEKAPLGLKVDSLEITSRDERGSQLSLILQVSGLQLNPTRKP
jgi:hypothetical protein